MPKVKKKAKPYLASNRRIGLFLNVVCCELHASVIQVKPVVDVSPHVLLDSQTSLELVGLFNIVNAYLERKPYQEIYIFNLFT